MAPFTPTLSTITEETPLSTSVIVPKNKALFTVKAPFSLASLAISQDVFFAKKPTDFLAIYCEKFYNRLMETSHNKIRKLK